MLPFIPLILAGFVGADIATEGESTQKVEDSARIALEETHCKLVNGGRYINGTCIPGMDVDQILRDHDRTRLNVLEDADATGTAVPSLQSAWETATPAQRSAAIESVPSTGALPPGVEYYTDGTRIPQHVLDYAERQLDEVVDFFDNSNISISDQERLASILADLNIDFHEINGPEHALQLGIPADLVDLVTREIGPEGL